MNKEKQAKERDEVRWRPEERPIVEDNRSDVSLYVNGEARALDDEAVNIQCDPLWALVKLRPCTTEKKRKGKQGQN